MIVLAIDPGPVRSAWLVLMDGAPLDHAIETNAELLAHIRGGDRCYMGATVIEQIESYGMPVGREIFETVHWAGRFTEAVEARGGQVVQMPRRAVKLHICGDSRAKDPNIRQALLDRFGGSSARGTKANPGPLYGITKDVWSALAIAVTYAETQPVRVA